MSASTHARLNEAREELEKYTDCFPWYWLSYGEKCYAFGVVEAVPAKEGDDYPVPGTRLEPHGENERLWIGDNGTEMMVMSWIASIEQQNGDSICKFLAAAHAHHVPAEITMKAL